MTRKADLRRQLDELTARTEQAVRAAFNEGLTAGREGQAMEHDRANRIFAEATQLERQVEAQTATIATLTEHAEARDRELARLRNDLATADVANGQLAAELAAANTMLDTASAEVLRHAERIDAVTAECHEVRRHAEQVVRDANLLRAQFAEIVEDAIDLRAERDLSRRQRDELIHVMIRLTADRDWLEARLAGTPLRDNKGHFLPRPSPRPT